MLHGIKTNFLTDGARAIASLSTAVIGIVGTAPDAPDAAFPLGARVLITDVGKALATIGKTGTLPQALAAIADQASPVIVLVRVGVDAQDQDTVTMAGIDLLLGAEMETGQRPRILGAPGLDTQTVTAHFAGVAKKLRGFLYFAGQGASVAEAITYRANFGEREMMMIWPNWSASFAGDAVARAMGLRARIDADTGWHKTISNVPVTGVTGISVDVTFDFGSEDTDAALLNAAGITTGGDLSKLGLVVEDMQAQSALRTLILNMDDYRKIRADLGKSGGTVQAAFAQREALDASVAWQSFTGTMSALAITLGATLLPSVTQFFGWVNTGVSAIARWAQANPELAGQIMTLASAFIAGRMALGALQFGFGSALSGLASLRNGFVMARTGIAFIQPAFSMISAMGGRLVPVILQIASALGTALPLAARALVGDLLKVGSAVIGIGRAAMAFVVANPFLLLAAGFAVVAYLIYANWDKVHAFLNAGIERIKGIFTGLPDWLKWAGKMMIMGLIAGLSPAPVIGHVFSLAQKVISAFRKPTKINSPSRVFMEMGGFLTQGLSLGIAGGTAQPLRAMGQMARRVAGAGALSLAGPSLAPSAMPGFARTGPQGASARAAPAAPITINIHQQPGEDAEALARRVMQLIDREKRASGRFADDFDT